MDLRVCDDSLILKQQSIGGVVMIERNDDVDPESVMFQRRFKRALYAFAIVEFVMIALAVYYKIRH